MKAVVMAGGEGTRLRPLTSNRPKPLVSICNKPIMQYIIELLREHGVEQIWVTLHYLADEIISYFGDGSEFGVQMNYSIEDEPLGTAGSVRKIADSLNDTFIIISGDALTDFNLANIWNYHKQTQAAATITLTRVENPLEYGVVITDENNRVRRFLEKPSWGELFSDTINTGIYILEPEVLNFMEEHKFYDFSKDIFPKMLEQDMPIYGHISDGYWCDVGNLQQYRQSHYDILQGKVKVQLPGEKRDKQIWIGEGSEIAPGATLEGPVVIGKNCKIKANAHIDEYTVVGDNCIVEEGAALQRSLIWNNVYIGKKSKLVGATLGRQCILKAHTVISEGVILGDKCFVGEGAVILPQVKIWPDKNVEAGATVSMSMIWGMRWPGSLFSSDGIKGLANIEITPEFALKLGAAYGAFLEKSSSIITSRDSHPATRMLNRSIICGLISVGVNVHDLRIMPTPISRYSVRNSSYKGGIHTRIASSDPKSVLIEFIDERGVNIDKNIERKIENIFFREDFRRTDLDSVGVIDFPSRAVDEYAEGFYNHLDAEVIRKSNFKIVVDYSYGNASLILPILLGKIGCETVAINAYLDPKKGREAQENPAKELKQLANIVTTLDADLGMLLDMDAERMVLVDEQGRIIDGSTLLSLISLLVLRTAHNPMIAIPVNAPSVIEKLAHDYKGKIIHTKTDGRSLMHTASLGEKKIVFAGNREGGLIFPQFQPAFDGMFAFIKLLELMARENTKLSTLLELIPPFFLSHEVMECSWQKKGKIMRQLIEESRNQPLEMIEGVKIFHEGGWVLIFPDPSEPYLHINAEGASMAQCEELIQSYKAKMLAMSQNDYGIKAKKDESKKTKAKAAAAIVSHLPEERAFHFWLPGRYLGLKANSLHEFAENLLYIDLGSVEYHLERGDFANWVEYELLNPQLAQKIRQLKDKGLQGETLRQQLIKLL